MSEFSDHTSSYREKIDLLAEEFAERLRRGENPTIDEYLESYPEEAEQIREVFPTLLIMDQALPAEEKTKVSTRRFTETSKIGDYRIVRQIGQGGMGVVYEAQQESLGRRVALKVLPFGISKDEKFIERFKREARAAAKLHHTNIVPVYDVGQDEDTFYYAMQFIDGQGLDDVQREVRRINEDKSESASESTISKLLCGSEATGSGTQRRHSYFKAIAKLGASVADALAYAHERSIVHRDVKPSNLILDTDGVVWLADFGLAKTDDSELTETGDFLGTARYMSPERFKGKGDHRGDIYGLGVTLYELLTLKRAFGADDRLHLIDQIANQEPRRPRDVNRQIPPDLETIVLKSMEKDPRRRYQNSADLADDLRRFLDDQPIRARRATLLERMSRWARRHKAQTAAMVSMAATIVILVVSALLISKQKDIAQSNFIESEKQKTRADIAAGDAKREAQVAREAVRKMLTAVGDQRLRNIPQMDGLRTQLLEEALVFNRKFLRDGGSLEDRRETAHAYLRIGKIYSLLENNEEVTAAFDQSHKHFQKIAETHPDDLESLALFAKLDSEYAVHLIKFSKYQEALPYAKDCIRRYESLSKQEAGESAHFAGKAFGHQLVGRIYRQTGKSKESEIEFRIALDVFEQMREREKLNPMTEFEAARTQVNLASLLVATRRPDQAKSQLDGALEVFNQLAKANPNERLFRESIADTCNQLGALHLQRGKLPDARIVFQKAVDELMSLAADFPQIPNYRADAANCLNGLAIAFAIGGESEAADKEFSRATEVFEQLAKDFPEVASFRFQLANSIRRLGVHKLNTNQPELAVQPFQRAYNLMESLSKQNESVSKYRRDLAELAFLIATTIHKTDPENPERVVWIGRAIDISSVMVKDVPDETIFRHKLAKYYRLKGIFRNETNQPQEAVELLNQAIGIQRKLVKEVPGYEEYSRHLAISFHDLSVIEMEQDHLEKAEQLSRQALEIRKANIQANPNRYDHSLEMLISRYQLGKIYGKQDQVDKAIEQYEIAIEYCRENIERVPEHSRFRYQYLVSIQELLELYVDNDQLEKAGALFKIADAFAQSETKQARQNADVIRIGKEIEKFWELNRPKDDPQP